MTATATTPVTFELPATARERLSDAVVVTDRAATEPASATEPRPRWPWAIALLAYLHAAVLGVWLLEVRGFGIGDAVSRTATARIMVRSSDPHLSAWGFYWMPIPTVSRVPALLLLEPFGLAHLSGALTSAAFLALTIPVIAATGRVLGLPTGVSASVCVLFAVNPIMLWSGATGMSETAFGLFAAVMLYGVCRFSRDRSVASLVTVGLGLAGCMGCKFETLVLTPVLAIALGIVAGRDRWRSAAVIVAIPPATVFALWSVASKLIQGAWFHWYFEAQVLGQPPVGAPWLPTDRTLVNATWLSIERISSMAPTIIVLLLALVVPHRARSTTLALSAITWVLPTAVTVQLVQGSSYATPRYYYHLILFGAIGVMWLWSRSGDHVTMRVLGYGAVAALAVSVPVGVHYLADPDVTKIEREVILMGPMLGREPIDLDTESGFGGNLDGYRRLADLIDERLGPNDRIAMDTLDAAAFLFSDKPGQFVLPENRDSLQILADPEGRFQLALVRDGRGTAQGDTIRGIVQSDPRWVLVEDFGTRGRLYEFVAEEATE
jgi:hypothetical protein